MASSLVLANRPVENDDDGEIQEKAVIDAELRYQVVGTPDSEESGAELDHLFGQLAAPEGYIQRCLTDGLVLCSATVTRKLSNNGNDVATASIRRKGRFTTTNPDLIERSIWVPSLNGMVNAGVRAERRIGLTISRQPLLADRRRTAIDGAYERLRLELPSGENGDES